MISLIAALTVERIIGIEKTIPWKLPADLAWFKYNTFNKPIIMGRVTFESIGSYLPGRLNIVVSSYYKDSHNKNIIWVNSLKNAVKAAGDTKEIMVIGGGSIYSQMLEYADRLYLTHIHAKIKGDTQFPDYNKLGNWQSIFSKSHNSDEQNLYDYCFEILERKF